MPTILDDLTPADLSLPAKFTEFREIQKQLVDYCLYGPDGDGEVRRFMACGAGPGSGKSLAAHALAQMSGMKTVILTATKALEDQQIDDNFDCVNIHGRANYQCLDFEPLHPDVRWSCEDGPDHDCQRYDTPYCAYAGRVGKAREARVVLTNYAYWLHARSNNRQALERRADERDGGQPEPIELLIADEAHLILGQLASFLSTWVGNHDLHRFADKAVRAALVESKGAESGRLGTSWVVALSEVRNGAWKRMYEIAREYESEARASRGSKEYRALERLAGNLDRVLSHATVEEEELSSGRQVGQPNWLWRLTRNGVALDVIWPARYAERYLWSGVSRVVLMSASLRPKALGLTGIKQSDSWFREWPRVFPGELSPVYWIPTGKMGHRESEEEKGKSITRLDEIGDEWREYKGIVHTNSYTRAKWYQANSKWGRAMVLSKPGEQAAAAEKYRKAVAPCMLVSPSFTTGFDFPDEDCGYQVIVKLPYPDRSDPVVLARAESDPDWYDYTTMNTLFQACGRKSRRADQRCVTMITDDSVKNFRHYSKQHAPRYFTVRESVTVPKAPGLMSE